MSGRARFRTVLAVAAASVAALPGVASASFGTPSPLATAASASPPATGDFNGDGRPDVVVADPTSNTVDVFLNLTRAHAAVPTFAAVAAVPVSGGPERVAIGDLNGDGRPDVAVTLASGGLAVFFNETARGARVATFGAVVQVASHVSPTVVRIADVNGDTLPDLIGGGDPNGPVIMLNETEIGSSTPTFGGAGEIGAPTGDALVLADINGDHRPDLIANRNPTGVEVLLDSTPANASVATLTSFTAVGSGPVTAVAAGDLNGDGRPDIAYLTASGAGPVVQLNTTAPGSSTVTFGAPTTFADPNAGATRVGLGVADVTGDGRPDLIVLNPGSSDSVLANTTAAGSETPSFAAAGSVGDGNTAEPAFGDFNGDGRLDYAGLHDAGHVDVLLDTSQPGPSPSPTSLAFGSTSSPQPLLSISAPRTVTVANTGDYAFTPTASAITGAGADAFLLGADDCTGHVIPAGANCSVGVRFAPFSAGANSATLTVSGPSGHATVTLGGVGANIGSRPGVPGMTGAPGLTGATGRKGATGNPGLAGASEVITCAPPKHGTGLVCIGRLVSGPVTLPAADRATVTSRGTRYTASAHRLRRSGLRLLLSGHQRLQAGRYTVTVRRRSHRRWVTVRVVIRIP